jgi:hypothetical protein
MSAILERWLRDDLRLSRSISDVSSAFSNGYLFGEVLHNLNQLDSGAFAHFVDDEKSDSAINNYLLLHPVMRQLGIPFDSRTAQQLMWKEKGAALAVLYRIKVAAHSFSGTLVGRQRGTVRQVLRQQVQVSKPVYAASQRAMFEKSLRLVAENQNDLYLAK